MSEIFGRPTAEEIAKILDLHGKSLRGIPGGERADLRGANLSGADLSMAYLSRANLRGAYLRGANLSGANLSGADLRGAYLSRANLRGAYLSGANLSWANLSWANLSGADLRGAYLSRANLSMAYLSRANLSGADLSGADLPPVLIQPEVGGFFAFKKLRSANGAHLIAKLWIPAESRRINSWVSRKCRADYAEVVEIVDAETGAPVASGISPSHSEKITYLVGQAVKSNEFNDDPRVDCAGGIHYFITRKEAEDWGK